MNSYSFEQCKADVGNPDNLMALLAAYRRSTPDYQFEKWAASIAARVEQRIPYWDLAAPLRQLAQGFNPSAYLVIGIRRGKSMARHLSRGYYRRLRPLDDPYGGADNPRA